MTGPFESQIPKGEDWVAREFAKVRREQQQTVASVARSVTGIVSALVRVDAVEERENTFAVTTTPMERAAGSIATPEGFTSAVVFVSVAATALNDTASSDYLTVRAFIGAAGGVPSTVDVAAGRIMSATATYCGTVSVSASSPVTVSARVSSMSGAWGVDAWNGVTVDAIAIFTK